MGARKVFFRDSVKILLNLNEEDYILAISKKANLTYSHTTIIIQKMERHGIVKSIKEGRIRKLQITPKGEKLIGYAKSMWEILG